MRVRAEGAAAVRDHFEAGRQFPEPAVELIEGNRASPRDVPGVELLLRAHVDEYDVAAPQPLTQLVPADAVDILAEIVGGGALDLGELGCSGIAKLEPHRKRGLAGERVAHVVSLAPAIDQ